MITFRAWKCSFIKIERNNLKFSVEMQRSNITQTILSDFKNYWRFDYPRLQSTLQSYSNESLWYRHKNIYIDNRIQLRTERCVCVCVPFYSHVIFFFYKGQNTHQEKYSIFNKQCWSNWRATCRRIKLGPYPEPHTQLHSKCIKDLK